MSLPAPAPHACQAGRFSAGRPDGTPRGSRAGDARGFAICAPAEPLLTADQERELAGRVAAGDRDARDRLVRANLRLVATIARGYAGRGLEPEDLVAEGYIGLITAAERFDPRFNVRFSTYAAHWIKQTIRDGLVNRAAMIRLPAHTVQLLREWRRTSVALERSLGREPSFDEVSGAMGLPEGKRRIIEQALRTRHLAARDEGRLEVAVPPGSGVAGLEDSEEREDLRRRLDRLGPIERSVIALRFGLGGGEPLTRQEIGVRLGYTREWVRKIEVRALAALA